MVFLRGIILPGLSVSRYEDAIFGRSGARDYAYVCMYVCMRVADLGLARSWGTGTCGVMQAASRPMRVWIGSFGFGFACSSAGTSARVPASPLLIECAVNQL